MPILDAPDAPERARQIIADRSKELVPRCSANVAGEGGYEACNRKVEVIDDWTYRCSKHGEMH